MEYVNYITKLNEYAQQNYWPTPEYVDLGSDGKLFTQKVKLNGVEYPEGVGRSKKEAKHEAAKNAMKRLEAQQGADDALFLQAAVGAEASAASGHQLRTTNLNHISWLNEYGQKNNVAIKPVESIRPGPNSTILFVVGDKEYPDVSGKTKKEAKEEAAKLVYEIICGNRTTEPADENSNPASGQLEEDTDQDVSDVSNQARSLSSKPQDSSSTETNFMGFVNNYCQEKRLVQSFSETGNSGPPHNPQFSCKLIIDNKEYPEGVGKNKKEARQRAAQLAWAALQEQSDWVSEASTRSDDSAPTTGIFTSEFESIQHLGDGGFGLVYKAREKLLNKYYAVKIVDYREEALNEAKKLSDLHNEHIVRYYRCWKEDSKYGEETGETGDMSAAGSSSVSVSTSISPSQYLYIQMELCDTKTLRDWIDERNQKAEQVSKRREAGLKIAQQVVTGVDYIHSKKLIHRDLKPANIMFGGDGAVKIGDFGLVTAEMHDDPEKQLERTKSRGTPTYMAPEQKNNPTYDRKVDIFALGLIFFELFWKISTQCERFKIWDDVRHRKFPDGFTDSFFQEVQIIKQMLSERPEDRPEAGSLKAELEKWTQQHLGNVTV